MKIISWNVDWCRNGERSTGEGQYCVADCTDSVYKKIIDRLKEIATENCIICLQEFPKQKLEDLKADFSSYQIIYNDKKAKRYTLWMVPNNIFVNMKNINNTFKQDSWVLYHNRISAICVDGVQYIGVHMPTNFTAFDSDAALWMSLYNYTKTQKNYVLVGDWNAYVGCTDRNTEKMFKMLLEDNICIPQNLPTYIGGTTIDHALIEKSLYQQTDGYIEVQEKFDGSDHKYILVDLNFSNMIA